MPLPWRDAAMLAAILLPCAAIASPPVTKPSSSFNSQSVFVGASATFTITATGDAPLVYQWRRDGAELPGQTNSTLRIGTTQPSDEGNYDVVVSNASCPIGTEKRKNATPFPTRFVDSNEPSTLSKRVTSGNGTDVPFPVMMLRAFQLGC